MDFFVYIIFTLSNFFTGYVYYLFIFLCLIFGTVAVKINKGKLKWYLILPLVLFLMCYSILYFQPGLTIVANGLEEKDFYIQNVLFYFVNPYTSILMGAVAVIYIVRSFQNKLSFLIAMGLLVSSITINALIFEKVFYFFRDTAIPYFYPYSRKVNPIKFNESLKICVPSKVKEYNEFVIRGLIGLKLRPDDYKKSNVSNYFLVSEDHLQKLYYDKSYFEEYLRLCYQNENVPSDFVNPFLGTDPRGTKEFEKYFDEYYPNEPEKKDLVMRP
jgi:hypothetical protein